MHQHNSICRYAPRFIYRLAMVVIGMIGCITSVLAVPPNIKHTMLVTGTGLNYVGIIDTMGKLIWKHTENEGQNGQKNDSWLLPDGNVVYSYQWGVRIVDTRSDKVLWDRRTPKRNNQTGETHSCQPLDGRSDKFLVGECFNDTAFIVEVDTTGKEWKRIGILNQGGGTHGKWRQIRKTAKNTYLTSSMDLYKGYEFDSTGRLIYQFPSGGYVTQRLDNGNTITGTGGDCRFVEFDSTRKQVWEVTKIALQTAGVEIGFAAELQRLPSGNTIITNWGGHGTGFGAAVVEIKPDFSIVGAIPDSFPASIASVKVIDGWKATSRQYTFTARAGQNGTISPSGNIFVDSAATTSFTITPNSGFGIDSVLVDGIAKDVASPYTFNNVNAPHTIAVTFIKSVGIIQQESQSLINNGPHSVVVRDGILTMSIPYSGSTRLHVVDCNGRMIAQKVVNKPGWCALDKKLSRGVYVVSLIHGGKKRYSQSISVTGE